MFGTKLVVLKDNSKNMKLLFQGGYLTGKLGKPGIPTTGGKREKAENFDI